MKTRNTNQRGQAKMPLLPYNRLVNSTDPRAPKADVSNAAHLMGDIYDETGDIDDETGDAVYGDPNTAALDTYNTLIGDTEEQGALRLPKIGRTGRIIGGTLLSAGATAAVHQLIKRQLAKRKRVSSSLIKSDKQNTISNQISARRLMGKIPRNAAMPFYQMIGATLNSYPLAPTESFAADTLKYNLDRQSTDTPFEVEIINGTFAGVTWTTDAPGVATVRYYACVILTVGISVLTANPGTIFSVVGVLPTINGNLTIAANPFSFTIRPGYYAKFMIFPWQLVTNKPLLALGAYSNANHIILNTTGLPSNASVSMIVPGSQHPWTIGMRNRLV